MKIAGGIINKHGQRHTSTKAGHKINVKTAPPIERSTYIEKSVVGQVILGRPGFQEHSRRAPMQAWVCDDNQPSAAQSENIFRTSPGPASNM